MMLGPVEVRAAAAREQDMDFLRNMQTKDWVVAAIAFVAGAIIF